MNYVAGTGESKTINKQEETTIPPQKPILSPLPEATNSASIVITGFTSPKTETWLLIDKDRKDILNSGDSGEFSFAIELTKGQHQIGVIAKNQSGKTSESETKQVTYDPEKLIISIDEPKDGSEFFGVKARNLTVKGKTNKTDSIIKVNGTFAKVDDNGNYQVVVVLNTGDNTVSAEGVDGAGNTATTEIKVKYSP